MGRLEFMKPGSRRVPPATVYGGAAAIQRLHRFLANPERPAVSEVIRRLSTLPSLTLSLRINLNSTSTGFPLERAAPAGIRRGRGPLPCLGTGAPPTTARSRMPTGPRQCCFGIRRGRQRVEICVDHGFAV